MAPNGPKRPQTLPLQGTMSHSLRFYTQLMPREGSDLSKGICLSRNRGISSSAAQGWEPRAAMGHRSHPRGSILGHRGCPGAPGLPWHVEPGQPHGGGSGASSQLPLSSDHRRQGSFQPLNLGKSPFPRVSSTWKAEARPGAAGAAPGPARPQLPPLAAPQTLLSRGLRGPGDTGDGGHTRMIPGMGDQRLRPAAQARNGPVPSAPAPTDRGR